MPRTFEQAASDVEKLAKAPTDSEKLELYGLFKIAKGNDISAAKKPGMFDLAGKAKYGSWEKLTKEGVTQKDAGDKYVALVDQLEGKYGKK